ncbi:MAG: SPFH domain-containing protein [Bacteroidales bacterium]|nr:SPFH domain-containing protein [Bacteroidales bacterium]MBR1799864.1 SPFH domain-containing protein [Bacteroidales bacterium]
MAIIDMVRWTPQEGEAVYAFRFPETNLSTYTQLVVYESQQALLFSKGQLLGKFGPGKHTLNTENLPLLRSLFGIPFGGKNPFTAEIWFVNLLQPANLEWQTGSMSVHDADYNTFLPLEAKGRYGVRVADAERFLTKLVIPHAQYTQTDLTDQCYGEFVNKTKSAVVGYMTQNRVGYKQVSAHLDSLSTFLRSNLTEFWNGYGIELSQFYITEIDIDTTTEEGRRVKAAIAEQAEMSITGHTWQQGRMFDTAQDALSGMGNGQGGILGGLMAIGMMGGLQGGNSAHLMTPNNSQPTFGQPQQQNGMGAPVGGGQMPRPASVFCSNCGKQFSTTSQFCPNCGHKYNPCPNCGRDNDEKAKRCTGCGTRLNADSERCPHCGAPVSQGSTFCSSCGKPMLIGDVCERCHAPLPPSVKFCPNCGHRR